MLKEFFCWLLLVGVIDDVVAVVVRPMSSLFEQIKVLLVLSALLFPICQEESKAALSKVFYLKIIGLLCATFRTFK